ncbi:hypothetical protein MAR_026327 [Mya arenaria]|uniref:Uncharacterized protein n=1 Tax=Mya arenaria TaxID=6604 RepID=A0ABY7ETA7_MYAAR|nr:hypothetical protein MAR_026327 [Mya arenaria]
MDMFKRIGNTALNAVLSVTPQFIKKKAAQFTEWLSDYVEPQTFSQTLDEIKEHVKKTYKKVKPFEVKESRSALRRFTTQYEIEGRSGYIPQTFLDADGENWYTGDVISEPASFHSYIEINLEGTDVSDLYTTMTDRIMEAISNFQRQGGNWVFKNIISLEIHTVKYQPLRGYSYIPLPKKLESKKAIINMKIEDDMCVTWCV